jgi:hypothetical protein
MEKQNGGEIRKLPAQAERVETGAVQFGDDWPGVFIRGDNAFHYAMCVRAALRGTADPFAKVVLEGLADLLAASDLTGLSKSPPTAPKTEHVCGLQGYNGMIDPPCPGCEARAAQIYRVVASED